MKTSCSSGIIEGTLDGSLQSGFEMILRKSVSDFAHEIRSRRAEYRDRYQRHYRDEGNQDSPLNQARSAVIPHVPSIDSRNELPEVLCDIAECRRDRPSRQCDGGDSDDRDQYDQEGVFNHARAGFVPELHPSVLDPYLQCSHSCTLLSVRLACSTYHPECANHIGRVTYSYPRPSRIASTAACARSAIASLL